MCKLNAKSHAKFASVNAPLMGEKSPCLIGTDKYGHTFETHYHRDLMNNFNVFHRVYVDLVDMNI
jgi:hypothetical protein